MVNSTWRHSNRRGRQKRHAPNIQDLTSLMVLLEKGSHKYPSSHARINAVIMWPGMGFGMYSIYQTLANEIINGIFFSISLNLPWKIWNSMLGTPRKVLRWVNTWYRKWCGKECTRGLICQMIFFRSYWHWCRWQKPKLRSMLPSWIDLSLIHMMLCRILFIIWRL